MLFLYTKINTAAVTKDFTTAMSANHPSNSHTTERKHGDQSRNLTKINGS